MIHEIRESPSLCTSFPFTLLLIELEIPVLMETGRFDPWPGPLLLSQVNKPLEPLPDLRLELKLKTIKRHNLSEQQKRLLSSSAVGTLFVLLNNYNDIYRRQGKHPSFTVLYYLAWRQYMKHNLTLPDLSPSLALPGAAMVTKPSFA